MLRAKRKKYKKHREITLTEENVLKRHNITGGRGGERSTTNNKNKKKRRRIKLILESS